MSGGGVDAGGGGSRSRKKGKRKPKKRMNVRIDMTPLVDVAFLLLTFFMMTTVFRKPSTMEINLPPNDVNVEIAESNLLTLRIDEAKMIADKYDIQLEILHEAGHINSDSGFGEWKHILELLNQDGK